MHIIIPYMESYGYIESYSKKQIGSCGPPSFFEKGNLPGEISKVEWQVTNLMANGFVQVGGNNNPTVFFLEKTHVYS